MRYNNIMYLKRKAISLVEAQAHLAALPMMSRIISKKVSEAYGYVLAEPVIAPFSIPFFRRSGYDGFGILAVDDDNFPHDFEVVENIGAGDNFTQTLTAGQCVRIMTGAKVPDEVEKVIMLEDSQALENGRVRLLKSASATNIAEIGEEVQENEEVVPKQTEINAGVISVLAAFGIAEVQVYDMPKVAVVATGSELSNQAENEKGKIYNSNGPLLAGLARENGALVTGEYELADDLERTRALIAKLTQENDFVITTGGVSVGDFDFLAVIAQENNCLFNKLSMRPGSPTTAFIMNGTPVIALSGNPSACFTGFWFFAEPLIRRFQGQGTRVHKGSGILEKAYTKKNSYDRYLNGVKAERVSLNGQGQSSELASLYQANCFFRVPHDQTVEAGDEVELWQLPFSG
jgi:molybdopterin molybdotransferase